MSLGNLCILFFLRSSLGTHNTFIQASIKYSICLIKEIMPLFEMPSTRIVIEGDPNFYSNTNCPIEKSKKTGLGSSAALVTSLVGGMLSHFLRHVDIDLLLLIHNTSQFVHCLVQGKLGSGFDVSAAVYGSQVYHRFSRQYLQDTLELASRNNLKDLKRGMTEK
jgi:phosphomevalonate kinase